MIANYGHGKSHLALALANYFGKPFGSEELKVLLSKIQDAVHDSAQAEKYKQFKRSNSKYLVICLRGDLPGSMRGQFIHELEKSLEADEKTRDERIPFWFTQAEKYLSELEGKELEQSNDYLKRFHTDVASLLDDVHNHKIEVFDRCNEVFHHVHGIYPDFGREVSLKEIVNWAVGKFCGTDKPYRGMLVLFDEFSLYLKNYVAGNSANELQDLLNGVDDNRQKVVFLAFSQHDPIEYVQTFISKGMMLDTAIHELGRLPKKVFLYSLMESVIDVYLDTVSNVHRIRQRH